MLDKLLDPLYSEDEQLTSDDIIAVNPDIKHSDSFVDNSLADYRYARNNIRQVIETGLNLLEPLAQMATDLEQPRSMELVSKHLKLLIDANKSLIGIHQNIKNITTDNGNLDDTETDDSIFSGTTADLINKLNMLIK